jgi:hypothetical protein
MSGLFVSISGTSPSDAHCTVAPPASAATPPPSLPFPPSGTLSQETVAAVDALVTPIAARLSPLGHTEGEKAGEAGTDGPFDSHQVSNAEFIAAVITGLPDGAFAAVCSKPGDPVEGGWHARCAEDLAAQCPPSNNNYLNCSSFRVGEDGSIKARKANFAACHFLLLDDLGSKVPLERLSGFELSWLIETSPGNFQGAIILAEPLTNGSEATRLLDAIIAAGLCDPGASGPLSRWGRLPNAINGKKKYADAHGAPFRCRLVEWRPDKRYTAQQIIDGLQLDLASAGKAMTSKGAMSRDSTNHADDVFTPKASENPVITELKRRNLYKTPLGSGKHDVSCPWVHEHTDALDTGAAYFEPDEFYPVGGFCCQHGHRDQCHVRQLLEFLGIPKAEARHMPMIRVVPGDMHRVVAAAERELASLGKHYQCGGLIVSISTDPVTGDPATVPTSVPALTRELSVIASWEKFDKRSNQWVRCDPPARHVSILYDAQSFRHLAPLIGVARQPYFRESDGGLITEAGYDPGSQRFGVFDPRQFSLPEPTPQAARAALTILEQLLAEFPFLSGVDKSAALSAILTAVARPTLAHAPAFHVGAPVFGSGKSYLCEVISCFAGPAESRKVSYPSTSEEATKAILSLLLPSPAVVEFDDMDTDWIPHGTIKRMLTADQITDRILGVSKTATVSTRTLFLGSGNNVGPIRDLLRRVLTIHLDPRCSTPATKSYQGSPVELIRKNRGAYVAAALTIIQAWRKAGSPRTAVESIATFGGAWADYCRHPLIWLGLPDPATSLLQQVKHDPDGDALGGLMMAWHKVFGTTPATVRKALEMAAAGHPDLLDAMREFPVEERGVINRSKLGWVLKKNANRIVGGLEFQKDVADGRTAWRVVSVGAPASPALPPFVPTVPKTLDITSIDDEGDL